VANPVRIVLCLKSTPDPDIVAELALRGQLRLETSNRALHLGHIPNGPYGLDDQALETVINLARSELTVKTTLLSVDPIDGDAVVRRAFQLGIESAYLIKSGRTDTSRSVVAELLAAAVTSLGADLLVVGDSSSDDAGGVLGGTLGALLGWPCIASARGLELENGHLKAVRSTGSGGSESVEVDLPVVVSILDDGSDPIKARAADVLAARDKKAQIWDRQEVESWLKITATEDSTERVILSVDEVSRQCQFIEGNAGAVAAEILDLIGAIR
jgi:electron transfer flavoprotein alpha/beta subunit